jgi:hypothetical protein
VRALPGKTEASQSLVELWRVATGKTICRNMSMTLMIMQDVTEIDCKKGSYAEEEVIRTLGSLELLRICRGRGAPDSCVDGLGDIFYICGIHCRRVSKHVDFPSFSPSASWSLVRWDGELTS